MNFDFDINNYNKDDFLEIFEINKDVNVSFDVIENKYQILLNNIENSDEEIEKKTKIKTFLTNCKDNLIDLLKNENSVILQKNVTVQKTINPIERKTEFKNLHFNSKYRKDYYTSSASNYQLTLPESCNNVISMKLSSISIPNSSILRLCFFNFFLSPHR